jgi:hypothetical protein
MDQRALPVALIGPDVPLLVVIRKFEIVIKNCPPPE